MGNRQNRPGHIDTISRTMREIVLEATAGEMDALAQEATADMKEMSEKGRNAINKAIALSKQNSVKGENTVLLHKGLNTLLTMLRRRDNLDEAELAAKANVDEDEIRRIEYDAAYLPSPRTIYNLEKAFSLHAGILAKLTGAIKHHSLGMEERVTAFAANAKQMGKLTREERHLLNAFLKFLAAQE